MRFSECIGQEAAIRRLLSARKQGRIAHAQLFLGPEGSGNLALALAYAQYLFCKNPSDSDSCGECPSCKKVSSYQYADLFFSFPYIKGDKETISDEYLTTWRACLSLAPYMDADHWLMEIASDTKQLVFTVHEAVSIMRKMSMKGYEGPLKIMIIWMAELIKTDTANKLLKLLEEPPENSLFFLVANQSDQILPTVLSRTQVMYVPRLPDRVIQESLESRGVESEQAADIAHYSSGNWWRAQQLLGEDSEEQDLASSFQSWMRMCFKRNVLELTEWVDATAKSKREQQKQFLVYALEQIRQNLVLNYGGPDLTRMSAGEADFARKFSPFINDLNAEDLLSELNKAHFDISRNVNSRIVLMDLSLKVYRMLNRQP